MDGEAYDAATARLEPYPLRASIVVRYNPEHRGDSVIEIRPDWTPIGLCAAVGLTFIAFGSYLVLAITGVISAWSASAPSSLGGLGKGGDDRGVDVRIGGVRDVPRPGDDPHLGLG